MIGMISLLLIIYTLQLFTRIASIILVYTGMPEAEAKFQARSAVTGCGFTTAESEEITNYPFRRMVVSNLMLIGNVGIIASISSLLLSLVHVNRDNYPHELLMRLLILGGGLIVIWLLSKSRAFELFVIRMFEVITKTPLKVVSSHPGNFCYFPGGFRVCGFCVPEKSVFAGRTVGECERHWRGKARLLGIQRDLKNYLGNPRPEERIGVGDVLVFHGSREGTGAVEEELRKTGKNVEKPEKRSILPVSDGKNDGKSNNIQ